MYPSRFQYVAPTSIADAIGLLHDGGGEAKVLAGGQSLVPLMKLRFAAPELLVDINKLPGLDHLEVAADGSIRVGALCRHRDLERSVEIARVQPTMAAAAPLIADPIVRVRGTLVGSLCHADPQGDWAAVVTALSGHVVAQGPGGRRNIAINDFVTGPFQNVLEYDEIAVEAVLPAPQGSVAGGFLKLERRVGDFATAGTAVSIELSGDRVVRAGIALTGVGSRTIDARAAADSLVGQVLTADAIGRAADLAAEAAQPNSDHRGSASYKRHIIHTFVTRILTRVSTSSEASMTSLYEEIPQAPADDVPVNRVTISVNGQPRTADVEPRLLLAHLLRQGFKLTGTHTGCDTTNCGACTVLLDGDPVKSCTMLAVQADGHEVTTVEGLAGPSELHPLQEGFKDEHGLQCGFCTPGMMLAAKALLAENPDPTEDEIRFALSGNLCRCTGYQNIVKSVMWAARKINGEQA